jgi:hypothetical protein
MLFLSRKVLDSKGTTKWHLVTLKNHCLFPSATDFTLIELKMALPHAAMPGGAAVRRKAEVDVGPRPVCVLLSSWVGAKEKGDFAQKEKKRERRGMILKRERGLLRL